MNFPERAERCVCNGNSAVQVLEACHSLCAGECHLSFTPEQLLAQLNTSQNLRRCCPVLRVCFVGGMKWSLAEGSQKGIEAPQKTPTFPEEHVRYRVHVRDGTRTGRAESLLATPVAILVSTCTCTSPSQFSYSYVTGSASR